MAGAAAAAGAAFRAKSLRLAALKRSKEVDPTTGSIKGGAQMGMPGSFKKKKRMV